VAAAFDADFPAKNKCRNVHLVSRQPSVSDDGGAAVSTGNFPDGKFCSVWLVWVVRTLTRRVGTWAGGVGGCLGCGFLVLGGTCMQVEVMIGYEQLAG
jgi:hypothetical protein